MNNKITEIESLLDMNDPLIVTYYKSWDLGDCSLIGLIKLLLFQEIKNEIKSRGQFYDGEFSNIFELLP